MTFLRRLIPFLLLPLALLACFLASAPWLRAFPADVMATPLIGTALISVLLPVVVGAIGVRRLWITALIDVVGFVFFTMLVTLREFVAFDQLWTGLVHGPSQILTYALPLVSPRTLLVAPIALCWVTGAVVGECLGRGWQSVLPYATLLVTFGLSYAATTRAITDPADGRRYDTLLAAGLLLTLLLLRAAQAWVEQDQGAQSSQPEGALPLHGLAIGVAVSIVVALVAAGTVQSAVFAGPPTTAQRASPLDRSQPLTPLSFVAGLRPDDPRASGKDLFLVTLDRTASRYVALADVDTYDGDGWSFTRKFLPSGGVVPNDSDPSLRPDTKPVLQQYKILGSALTKSPWMPFQYRPEKISALGVNVDADSGMIVPRQRLRAGQSYSVRSSTSTVSFGQLPTTALTGTSLPPIDTYLPPAVRQSLGSVIDRLQTETGVGAGATPIAFLQAVMKDFRTNYAQSGGPNTATSPTSSPPPPTTTPKATATSRSQAPSKKPRSTKTATRKTPISKTPTSKPVRSTPTPPASPSSASASPPSRPGGNSFANVLASILGTNRSATPEQFATFVAVMARQLGVPARVVSGFRISAGSGGSTVGPGTYTVTSKNAWSWVEIPIRGQGWVVLDAAPTRYSTPRASATPTARPAPSASSQTPAQAPITQNAVGNAPAPQSRVPNTGSTPTAMLAIIVVCVLAGLVLVAGIALVLRKRWRTHRRRRIRDPRRRLIGAWQEGLDILVEAGLPEVTALTSAEVAAVTAVHFGVDSAAAARYLGDTANAAIFSTSSWVGTQTADDAWRALNALRKSVRGRLTTRDKLGAGLRYHRNRRAHPLVGPASWAAAKLGLAQPNRARHSIRAKPRGH